MHTTELILVNQKDGSFIKDISGNIIIRDIYDVDEVLYADEITNESYNRKCPRQTAHSPRGV